MKKYIILLALLSCSVIGCSPYVQEDEAIIVSKKVYGAASGKYIYRVYQAEFDIRLISNNEYSVGDRLTFVTKK